MEPDGITFSGSDDSPTGQNLAIIELTGYGWSAEAAYNDAMKQTVDQIQQLGGDWIRSFKITRTRFFLRHRCQMSGVVKYVARNW